MGALDVVIVTYRSRDLLRNCLASLYQHAPNAALRVCVIDNASGDGSVELIAEQFPQVDVLGAGRNLGFAAATNLGIRRGRGEYVLALNPDTRLRAGTLDRLLEVMETRPEIGICGCRLIREDGTFDHAAKRSFPTPVGAIAHFTWIGRWRGAPRALAQYRAPDVEEGPVDAVNGAFMLMRRAALDEVGLFDEGYWMYMEDLDLCYRFKQAGWVTWYEPTVSAIHTKRGTTGGRRSPSLMYHFHRGMYRFYRSHYSGEHSSAMNALVYTAIAGKLLVALLRSAGGEWVHNMRGPTSDPGPDSA